MNFPKKFSSLQSLMVKKSRSVSCCKTTKEIDTKALTQSSFEARLILSWFSAQNVDSFRSGFDQIIVRKKHTYTNTLIDTHTNVLIHCFTLTHFFLKMRHKQSTQYQMENTPAVSFSLSLFLSFSLSLFLSFSLSLFPSFILSFIFRIQITFPCHFPKGKIKKRLFSFTRERRR